MVVCHGVFKMTIVRLSDDALKVSNSNSTLELRKWSLLALVLFPLTVRTQKNDELFDLPLTQLVNVEVQTASRFTQKSSEAPSAVEVLTTEDIRSFGWRTQAEPSAPCATCTFVMIAIIPIWAYADLVAPLITFHAC